MSVIVNTRAHLRQLAREKYVAADVRQKIYDILDTERNVELPKIGIGLEDTRDSSLWYAI